MGAFSLSANLTFPTAWGQLTERQLRFAYRLIAGGCTSVHLKTHALLHWANLRLVGRLTDGTRLFRLRRTRQVVPIGKQLFAALLTRLDWLDDLPPRPVRLATLRHRLRRYRAADPELRGLPFEAFIYCDNLYQGYLHTHDNALLVEMAQVLYTAPRLRLSPAEAISIFYWFAAVKALFARTFTHFLQPLAPGQPDAPPDGLARQLTESMNAQLRALTKGDVTKETTVRQLDTWRALYELDALARDAEDLKRMK